jgi:hypothetical protein
MPSGRAHRHRRPPAPPIPPGAIVSRVGPELAGLRAASARIEHRRCGFVGEQFHRRFEMSENALAERPHVKGGSSDPISERRTIEMNALAFVDLRLAIERQVIGIFCDEHVGDCRLGRQPRRLRPSQAKKQPDLKSLPRRKPPRNVAAKKPAKKAVRKVSKQSPSKKAR